MADWDWITLLVGDIGGTNTRLLLFQIRVDDPSLVRALPPGRKAPGLLLKQERYLNQDYANFTDVLIQFLREANLQRKPATACFAVAGPVKGNSVTFTNRDGWKIDGKHLESLMGIGRVTLCNDFLAVGYGLLTLEEDGECEVLQQAQKQLGAPIACIGAGTGLGECYLTATPAPKSRSIRSVSSGSVSGSNGDLPASQRGDYQPRTQFQYQCFASEGGHSDYSPRDAEQVALMDFLKAKFGQDSRVSVERVVSGTGLVNIFEFLCTSRASEVNPAIKAEVEAAGDLKGAIIAKHQKTDAICNHTMKLFATAYGAEAGNAALKWLPFGGLYLTGGLTPKNMELLTAPQGVFMRALRDKGRLSGVLEGIPIFAVKTEDLGERGAHYLAFTHLQEAIAATTDEAEEAAKITGRRRAAALKWLKSLVVPLSAAYAVTVVSIAAVILYRRR